VHSLLPGRQLDPALALEERDPLRCHVLYLT
jgi:hypothetical protein